MSCNSEMEEIKKQLKSINEKIDFKKSDNELKKEKLDDIKIFFDGIRNIGICFVFIASAIYLQENFEESLYNYLFIAYSLAISIVLFYYNALWVYGALSESRENKNILIFLIVYIVFTVGAGIPILWIAWEKIDVYISDFLLFFNWN